MSRYLGIDPGQSGALVEVAEDGRTILRREEWRRVRVPPALDIPDGCVLAVEMPYVGPGASASLTLAEWTGRLLAQVPPGVVVTRPTAQQWRLKVLRANPRRGPAKALALRVLREQTGLEGVPDHVAEAWCLARYAWGWDRAGRP